jgi:hypothetical protein
MVVGTDQAKSPLDGQDYVSGWEVLAQTPDRVKLLVRQIWRDFGIVADPKPFEGIDTSNDPLQRKVLTVTIPVNGGEAKTFFLGQFFAEISDPAGYSDSDYYTHFIGVDLTKFDPLLMASVYMGNLRWLRGGEQRMNGAGVPLNDDLPFAFVPDVRPVDPPAPVVSAANQLGAASINGNNPGFFGYSEADHNTLVRMNKWLDSVGAAK